MGNLNANEVYSTYRNESDYRTLLKMDIVVCACAPSLAAAKVYDRGEERRGEGMRGL